MADESPTAASPSQPRPKPSRTSTTGTVRGRTSPNPTQSEQNGDGRPPTKRARKAINCEPCRNSKLKCDRNRPCSSCVLRGTTAMCYQDARAQDGSDPRGDDQHYTRIDPAQEISRLRHSLSLLEAYIFPTHRNHTAAQRRASEAVPPIIPKKETIDPEVAEKIAAAPGMLGSQEHGGLYAGPTSTATHLITVYSLIPPTFTEYLTRYQGDAKPPDQVSSRQNSQDRLPDDFPGMTPEYDRDLLALLPSIEVIDGLIGYYFEYCNWIYRHVNQSSFTSQWQRFKNGTSSDRIVLATACTMMAVATNYLPPQHPLMEGFQDTYENVGIKFFEVSTSALQRRLAESRSYSLELIELLLVRTHFLTLSKTDSEEIWHVRGELVTIGMAMGLHRDPGKLGMHKGLAERRRWAWWHIVLLERWQAFMFGRPLAFASHHFDTQLPSFCDPSVDKTGRLYLPNIALFRLAFILGDIMDDAVSVRPIPYESVQANDRALTQWMDSLPHELDLDEYRVARSLASPNNALRRLGVQSVIIRTSYYHIRFTLHRPHASANATASGGKPSTVDPAKTAQSLEIAVGAADKLITMAGQSRPDALATSSLAVPGHMTWGPFHCFSAAMFFSFQLIANPDQPGAGLFRSSIRKAIAVLESARGNAVADKAFHILQALAPLYSGEYPVETAEEREKMRAQVLGTVRKLAFPYHDSHDPRRFGDSPSIRGSLDSPAGSSSVSPPMGSISTLPQYDLNQGQMPSMRVYPNNGYPQGVQSNGQILASPQTQAQLVQSGAMLPNSTQYSSMYPVSHQQIYTDTRYAYAQPMDESTMWGAAVGIGQGEWSHFLDGLRPEISQNNTRHLQPS